MKGSHNKKQIGKRFVAGALSVTLAMGGAPVSMALAEQDSAEQQVEATAEKDLGQEETEPTSAAEPQLQAQAESGLEAQESTQSVSYLRAFLSDEGMVSHEVVEDQACTVVTDSEVAWGEEGAETWYVVSGEVLISQQRITCSGIVNLVLTDGSKLTASRGITTTGATLNIFGQAEGSGELICTGWENWAGIGGTDFGSGGEVNIHGGTVNATGGMYNGDGAAGIGGGAYADGGTVTIYGGTVTATGSGGGAGIGGGIYTHGGDGGNGGDVAIYGGEVLATGDYDAEGIGRGYDLPGSARSNGLTLGDGVVMQVSDDNSTWSNYDAALDIRARYMKTVVQDAWVNLVRPVPTPVLSCLAHLRGTGDVEGTSGTVDCVGTVGQCRRLEGLSFALGDGAEVAGGIRYMVHMRTLGWSQGWKADGDFAGTRAESRRVEAMRVELTGDLAEKYDVWYRVHCRIYGWLGWAKNGEGAGTTGQSRRMEAYQIVIMPKGSTPPGSTIQAFEGEL